jgi:hypothetical protein
LDCLAPLQGVEAPRVAVADAVKVILRGRECSLQLLRGARVVASICKVVDSVVAHFVASKSGVGCVQHGAAYFV